MAGKPLRPVGWRVAIAAVVDQFSDALIQNPIGVSRRTRSSRSGAPTTSGGCPD
jgi:hypothetical protein